MNQQQANKQMVSRLLFRLLPVQICLAAVGAVNGTVSGLFASNFVGMEAMSAIGLYAPFGMLIGAFYTMLAGGSVILCGKYLGRNERLKIQHVFSLNLLLSALISALFILVFFLMLLFGAARTLTEDAAVRTVFNRYLLGQIIGVFPTILGNQLPAFLSLENKGKRALQASLVFIGVNILLNALFVGLLRMDAFGLSLAGSLGMWVFLLVEAWPFINGKADLRIAFQALDWKESGEVLKIGFPGAVGSGYQTLRGLIVNRLITLFVGSVGISAFTASDSILRLFWAIPGGMLAVSRLLISVSVGEEDRQTLTDVMRNMFTRFIPLMCAVSAVLILLADPFTRLFYRDPASPVFQMTVMGFRILPLCMPLSVICMHFVCYAQVSNKQFLVHLLSAADGVVFVAGFTALLIRALGMNSVYIANVLNGVMVLLAILAYAIIKKRRFPRNMEDLMVIPEDFGVSETERLDLTLKTMDDVIEVSRRVQMFCLERGIDERRAYLSGLALEEMAGNVIAHGFSKDKKKHTVDVRVVHKGNDVILRIKDDCVTFDPAERQRTADPNDISKNVGIRMIYKIATEVQHQNLLGLNVLTIRI